MLLFTNLISSGQRRLLGHPLLESFLHLKWKKIRKFFIFNLVFFAAFVFTLTYYVMRVFRERCLEEDVCGPQQAAEENKTCEDYCGGKNLTTVEDRMEFINQWDVTVSWYLMIIFAFWLMLKELFQIVQNVKQYFRSAENLLQLSVLALVVMLVNLFFPSKEYFLPFWKYHIAGVTLFCAWVELMFLVGR
jgi:hypothetical protein